MMINIRKRPTFLLYIALACTLLNQAKAQSLEQLKKGFLSPPGSARPGVYWYFMDGNMSREAMTADLESMKKAGLGNLVFLEVNVGIPRGPVNFLSNEWQELFAHAVHEAERLGIEITLGIGPGWTGSGGPWIKPEQSMQHLVASSLKVTGPGKQHLQLEVPKPRKPFFGEGTLTPELKKEWLDYYKDIAVLAYPTPDSGAVISDVDEKALYYRAPYTSQPGVKQYLPSVAGYAAVPAKEVITKQSITDLSNQLKPDGTLDWEVPPGNWTILRFVSRNNGAVTRPAPLPGLGFEADKFDTTALNAHLDDYIGKLLNKTGMPSKTNTGGLKRLHMDSWEMGAQNWTPLFRQEFTKRRGYDPLPFYPVYTGQIIESREMSERFLWDLRQTSQELILEYHAMQVKKYGRRKGLELSIEPYDMNPTADLELGAIADVPMSEFWSRNFGFTSSFSCIEAASIAHVNGASLVPAEAFTAQDNEGWKQHPASMKAQGDWAFAAGINRFVYHTFQHQFLDSNLKPGATMGPYGVQWNRGQTWWPLAASYHQYITRCSYLLQQGRTVADILYLTPEGAPHVFRAPATAMDGDEIMPDRKGFNFDGCAPGQLYKAGVKDHHIVFPGGASYSVLVLPAAETMTPALLNKIAALIKEGANVIGTLPPLKSPGLSGYPACDAEIKTLVAGLWKDTILPPQITVNTYGKGRLIWGGALQKVKDELYPSYDAVAAFLHSLNLQEDFENDGSLRYTHRTTDAADIYFVSNRTAGKVTTQAVFRVNGSQPRLWNAVDGELKMLPEYTVKDGRTMVPLTLEPNQSFFVLFPKTAMQSKANSGKNFPVQQQVGELTGAWKLSFDTAWGGPASVIFNHLQDWSTRQEQGIRYYSGKSVYTKQFNCAAIKKATNSTHYFLDLGDVKNMASVQLNGHDLGVLWTTPWRVDITKYIRVTGNQLKITVINLWPNRLIGDEQMPDDGIKDGKWPEWLLHHQKRTSGRYTFTTAKHYTKDSPLLPSGLLGPVSILKEED